MRNLPKKWFAVLVAACAIAVTGATSLTASAAPNVAVPQGRATAPVSHWCNTNGVTCTEPLQNWDDFPFFKNLERRNVNIGE